MEQTLIVFKPDSVQRGLVGEILARFEKVGFKIVGMKMVRPDSAHFAHHYEAIGQVKTRRGEKVYENNLKSVMNGPVIAAVLEGVEAAELVRKMVGATEPKSALPGTIRGDYAHMSYPHADAHDIVVQNLIHASGDAVEAKLEVAHWFKPDELHSYDPVHAPFTQPQ